MTNSDTPIAPFSDMIGSIRRNAPMYLGGVNFFGFIQYLVSAFDVMFENGATWIEIEVGENIRLSSDAHLTVRIDDNGLLEPFETPGKLKHRHLPDATIVTALSDQLTVVIMDGNLETHLVCKQGERQFLGQMSAKDSQPAVQLTLTPDFGIFSVREVSPAVLHSYCRRTACLYPGVKLRIREAEEMTEYHSSEGIRDFFAAVSLPYQLLHKPISLAEEEDDLKVEAVFVFQSWTDSRIWSFANKGRVPDGGTHVAGLLDAVTKLHHSTTSRVGTGILAVLAIEYPQITYEGCIKSRIGNPELREKVSTLVSQGLHKWAEENEDEIEYLESIERFQFADTW